MRNQYQIMTIFPKISQKRKESNIMEKDNVKYKMCIRDRCITDTDAQMADIEFLDPLKLHFSPVQGVKGLPGMLKQDFPFCCELHLSLIHI